MSNPATLGYLPARRRLAGTVCADQSKQHAVLNRNFQIVESCDSGE
ncbi:MAG: hypothetical protein NTZ72_00335 [Afipia sp.]|nr:hypothetical protein [Afipia sp.]